MRHLAFSLALILGLNTSCEGDDPSEQTEAWAIVHEGLDAALLSVWGSAPDDVWAVGGDMRDGTGPLVIHFDGEAWTRMETGEASGNLWWVFGFDGGPVYMGGEGGVILRYENDQFTLMDTPGTATVFGIWGASPGDVWAVGGASESMGGFAWRLAGDAWVEEPSLPADVATGAAVWKVYGSSGSDAWLVGSNGVALHWDGSTLTPGDTGVGSSLFTVHERDGIYTAVGGLATGIIVEYDGASWVDVTPAEPPQGLSGVTLGADGTGIAVGTFGTILARDGDGWHPEDTGLPVAENLHGSWIDENGGIWVVGGQTLAPPFTDGVLMHRGRMIPSEGL